jgi:hypothetical protein
LGPRAGAEDGRDRAPSVGNVPGLIVRDGKASRRLGRSTCWRAASSRSAPCSENRQWRPPVARHDPVVT